MPQVQHCCALAHVFPCAPNPLASHGNLLNTHMAVRLGHGFALFLRYDCICPRRNGRTCKDACNRSSSQSQPGTGFLAACGDALRLLEHHASLPHICATHGIAVHGTVVQRRHLQRRHQLLRKHPAIGIKSVDGLGSAQGRYAPQQLCQCLVQWQQRWACGTGCRHTHA